MTCQSKKGYQFALPENKGLCEKKKSHFYKGAVVGLAISTNSFTPSSGVFVYFVCGDGHAP